MNNLYKIALLNWIPDEIYLKIMFRCKFGRKLNLIIPKTFNEKLQWLKLYDRKDEYKMMVDKIEVRKFVSDKIGSDYLIPILGFYESFEEIDFDKLPEEFVLKCTHDSGSAVVCSNKSKFNKEMSKEKLDRCLKRNMFWLGREWPYKDLKPRIICEKLMKDKLEVDLKDYKFMCFNGKVKCSFVCSNRNIGNLNVDFYDLDWNRMPFERHYPRSETIIPKPENYNLMVDLAEKLSNSIPFVRVDFYEIDSHVYFGELTFFPGNGMEEFTPEIYDEILGNWIVLPQMKVGN